MRCIAQRHLGGNVNAREYTGNRIGMDFLHKHVLPRMAADPRAHLVINLYMHYNELVYMDHLAEVFRRTHIMDRVTVVVDPSRVTQDAEMAVARLRLAGVGVLDLRPVFRRYVEQWERGEVGGADNEAEPMFHGHLGGGLQRVLVNHLLTHVALKAATGSRRDIGDIPNALEPSVCR